MTLISTCPKTTITKSGSLCKNTISTNLISEPTHFTEHSSSLIDLIFVRNINNVLTSGVADPFIADWWRFTAAKFTIRNFYNPFSQKCKPNNFLKSSSILTLMSLNSAFKHVSLLHSDNYKERPNIQNKENFKLLKNNTLMMLSAISADEYEQNKQTMELDSVSRTF